MLTSNGNITRLENVIEPEAINAPCVAPFAIKYSTAIDTFKKAIGGDANEIQREKFLTTMRFVETHYDSWTWRTVVINANDFLQYGDIRLLESLWKRYHKIMLDCRQISELNGCDGVVYVMQ